MFLGFGISLGAEFWRLFSADNLPIPDGQTSTCLYARGDVPWWRQDMTSGLPLWLQFFVSFEYLSFSSCSDRCCGNSIEITDMCGVCVTTVGTNVLCLFGGVLQLKNQKRRVFCHGHDRECGMGSWPLCYDCIPVSSFL
jgi:hypothetical protein